MHLPLTIVFKITILASYFGQMGALNRARTGTCGLQLHRRSVPTDQPTTALKKTVFISHASKNFNIASEVCTLLEAHGIPCWIAPRDIPAGGSYGEHIARAIEQCLVTLLILTEQANESRAVANELELSFAQQNVIIPLRLHEVRPAKTLEFFVANAQWVDAFATPLKRRVSEIVRIVRATENGVIPDAPAPEQPTLFAKAERLMEQSLRYPWLSASIAFLLLAGLGLTIAVSTQRIASDRTAELEMIQRDPTRYGLIRASEPADGSALAVPGKISLWVSVQSTLQGISPDKVLVQAITFDESGQPSPVDLDSSLSGDWMSSAQTFLVSVPSNSRQIVFCMSAPHPELKSRFTARWSYSIRVQDKELAISKAGVPTLIETNGSVCGP